MAHEHRSNGKSNNINLLHSNDWQVELELDAKHMQDIVKLSDDLITHAIKMAQDGNQKQCMNDLLRLKDNSLRLVKIVQA